MTTELDTFETALLAELRTVVADRAPTRHRKRTLTLSSVAASAAAAAVGIGFAVGGSSPAFAVHRGADGDISVTINRLDDASGLQGALAAQGVTAEVDYNHPITLKTTDGRTIDVIPLTGKHGSPAPHAGTTSGGAMIQLGAAEGGDFDCSFGKGGHVTLDAVDDGYRITIPHESVLARTPLHITTTETPGHHARLAVGTDDDRCIQIASAR